MYARPLRCGLAGYRAQATTLEATPFRSCPPRIHPPKPAGLRSIGLWQTKQQHRCLSAHQVIRAAASSSAIPNLESQNELADKVHDFSLQLSQRPMNGNAIMRYTLYSKHGLASHVGELPKLGIAEKYGLTTRDLRVFDLPSGGFPHILVRENTILIHLFDLRLLVQDDQTLLFHIASDWSSPAHHEDPGENSQWPRAIVPGKSPSSISRVFSQNLEAKVRDGQGGHLSIDQPYELRVMEAALASVTSVLEAEFLILEKKVSGALRLANLNVPDREESLIHTELHMILDLTRKLAGIEQRARQVRNAIQEVLNEDEDMANMHLTDKRAGRPHKLHDHQDVEYLFEAYFKTSDSVVQEAASLIENIRRTEETIQSTLSVRRNQIMVLEAKIEIIMLALAWGTLVAGWYGMNVINYFEESSHAFAVLVSLSLTGIFSGSWYGMRKLRHIYKLRV